jgi:hypothetical protein
MDVKSLDTKTAFAAGFAVRCAEEQLSQDAISDRIKAAHGYVSGEKAAYWNYIRAALGLAGTAAKGVAAAPGAILNGIGNLAGAGGRVALTGATLGGVAGGLGGGSLGWLAAKANEKDIDPEDIKAKEIEETYKHYAARLAARRQYEVERAKRLGA